MSSFINCFDAVSLVVDEYTKEVYPMWRINGEKQEQLSNICDCIDSIIEEFEGEGLEAEIDENSKSIGIKIKCPDITIYSNKHTLYDILNNSTSFSFSRINDDLMMLEITFPGIWEENL